MKIKINDTQSFDVMLKSIAKVVPDAQFNINKDGIEVKVINANQTIRAYFKSKCMTSKEDITFCFKDILNFKKSVNLIESIEGITECELDFNSTFITYKGDVKFKLKVVKSDIIEQYITTDISTKLAPVFKFVCQPDNIKQVMQCSNIVDNNNMSKVYFSQNGDNVICEVDDKTNTMANSVGIPVSDELDGSIDEVIAMSMDNFQLFGTLPADELEITYTDKKVFEMNCNYDEEISLKMILTTIKN